MARHATVIEFACGAAHAISADPWPCTGCLTQVFLVSLIYEI